MRMILDYYGHGYLLPGDYCEAFRETDGTTDRDLPSAWYQQGIPTTNEALRLFKVLISGGNSTRVLPGRGLHPITKTINVRGARAHKFFTVDHGAQRSFQRQQILDALLTNGPFMVNRRAGGNYTHVVVVTGLDCSVESPQRETTQIHYIDPNGGVPRSSSEREFLGAMCDFTGVNGSIFPLSLRGEVSQRRPIDSLVQ